MEGNNLRRYDYILKDIIFTIKEDYPGYTLLPPDYQPSFYVTACGTRHHHNEMTDLLFLQYASQFLATTRDRSLNLKLRQSGEYTPWNPGFFCRRWGDDLIITHVFADDRLSVGDKIIAVNGTSPGELFASMQKNFFYSDIPERQLWLGLMKMAGHILVERKDGRHRDLPVMKFTDPIPAPRQKYHRQGDTVYFSPTLTEGESIPELCSCGRLILDLRRCSGNDYEAAARLLDYILPEKIPAALLPEEKIMTLYTAKNAACLCYPYEKHLETHQDSEISEYVANIKEKAGAGFVEETSDRFEGLTGTFGGKTPEQIIVLSDTWTANAAEAVMEIGAKYPHVTTIGRPSMGTLDYSNPITKSLDKDYLFTYPVSIRKSALSGHGIKDKGLPVKLYIPFTPEELSDDIILTQALKY